MDAIAKEVQAQGKLEELARALEMPHCTEDVKTLLQRWKKDMILTDSPARSYLMFHLASIGMQDLHDQSVT